MHTGELIRKYRKMRGMTQAQLAASCDMSDSAIRNYELGNREPGKDQTGAIAKALQIAPEALDGVSIESAREALELLFRLEDAMGLRPKSAGGAIVLELDPTAKNAPKLAMALGAWKAKIDSLDSGETTVEDYELWKASLTSD